MQENQQYYPSFQEVFELENISQIQNNKIEEMDPKQQIQQVYSQYTQLQNKIQEKMLIIQQNTSNKPEDLVFLKQQEQEILQYIKLVSQIQETYSQNLQVYKNQEINNNNNKQLTIKQENQYEYFDTEKYFVDNNINYNNISQSNESQQLQMEYQNDSVFDFNQQDQQNYLQKQVSNTTSIVLDSKQEEIVSTDVTYSQEQIQQQKPKKLKINKKLATLNQTQENKLIELQNKKPSTYSKNICRYLTRKTIRCFCQEQYKKIVKDLCDNNNKIYKGCTEYFNTNIENITGFKAVKEYFDYQNESNPTIANYKKIFKKFYIWFLKNKITRYILTGDMEFKDIYIKYKNKVMLKYVDHLHFWNQQEPENFKNIIKEKQAEQIQNNTNPIITNNINTQQPFKIIKKQRKISQN